MFSILTSNAKIKTTAETNNRNKMLPAVPNNPTSQIPRYSPTLPRSSFVPGRNSSPAFNTPKKEAIVSPKMKRRLVVCMSVLKVNFLKKDDPHKNIIAGNTKEK